MGLSGQDMLRIQGEFEKEYRIKEPLSDYRNMCGITRVCMHDKNAPADQKNDFCIYVGLYDTLPENLVLPEEYQGVRVFVNVVGEVHIK